jgi:hypothetical protein
MSDYTTTPNLGLFKPTVNADGDQWGDHWNANADKLDSVVGGPLVLKNLPTSPAGLPSGTVWSNGGVLMVAP